MDIKPEPEMPISEAKVEDDADKEKCENNVSPNESDSEIKLEEETSQKQELNNISESEITDKKENDENQEASSNQPKIKSTEAKYPGKINYLSIFSKYFCSVSLREKISYD